MKVAVVYGSLSGNTERLAKGIFDKIQGFEKSLFNIKENPNIDDYDVVISGFWIDKSFPHKEMKEFISNLRNKKVFLFGTMGHFPDSEHGENCSRNMVGLIHESCKMIGYFLCNGKIDVRVLEGIKHMKAETVGEKAFKAHMLDEKNLLKYKILGEHVNEDDIAYCSSRVNERLKMEEELEKL